VIFLAWKGIPKFMHQRPKGQHDSPTYICGTTFQSWSSKWMGAHSDTVELDGETVFRFTIGKEVAHLPLCPDCWAPDTYVAPAPAPEFTLSPVVESEVIEVEDGEEESFEGIFLWDYIK
jgi:hypothetical protein